MSPSEFPILAFASAADWEAWLSENGAHANGLWLRIAKKDSGVASVTYDEAVDVALCHGWIDGQRKTFDEGAFVQKFTPRRARSIWSKRNVGKVETLTAAGRMRPAGLAQVEAAKADGRWDAAYDSPKDMVVPDDLLTAVAKNERALAFFETLNKAQRYSIAFRLHHARTETTRERRIERFLAAFERGEFPAS